MSTYRVRVNDRNIVSLVQVGELGGYARDVAKRVEATARIIAPKRSGRLAASHVTLPTSGSNQYHSVYRVSAMAFYAGFVHEGTGVYGDRHTPIRSARGMRMPSNGFRGKWGRTPKVIFYSEGQRKQPWLREAAEIVGGSI